MSYGFFHCLDSFLFIYTFLPLRVMLACLALLVRSPLSYLGIITVKQDRLLQPAEIIDLLKCLIIGSSYVDTSMLYYMIKSQSVIKLYLKYNIVKVADRLFSAFGQDTIDALFWTATEPRGKERAYWDHPPRAPGHGVCLPALHAGAAAGHHAECGHQCQQQGLAHHHDEQQLCGTKGERVQEV